MSLSVFFGISHCYENGIAMAPEIARDLFALGVGCIGLIAIALLAATVVSQRASWQQIAVRVAGSWVSAIGIMMVGLAQ